MKGASPRCYEGGVKRILVGLDGSDGAAEAARWAVEVARAIGGEILAVHVFQPPALAIGLRVATVPAEVLDDAVGSQRDAASATLEGDWTSLFREHGIPYGTLLADGSPGRELVRVAEEWGADAIVVGRRGHGELTDLILGSVGHHLIHHAHRPVVIVPHRAG